MTDERYLANACVEELAGVSQGGGGHAAPSAKRATRNPCSPISASRRHYNRSTACDPRDIGAPAADADSPTGSAGASERDARPSRTQGRTGGRQPVP